MHRHAQMKYAAEAACEPRTSREINLPYSIIYNLRSKSYICDWLLLDLEEKI